MVKIAVGRNIKQTSKRFIYKPGNHSFVPESSYGYGMILVMKKSYKLKLSTNQKFSLSFLDLSLNPSALSLLVSNVVTIFVAVSQNWNVSEIVITYWFQSVAIGLFQFLKILDLKDFSTKGYKINGRSVSASRGVKLQTALFFLLHYGFFHLIYLVFIVDELGVQGLGSALPLVFMFFANHLFSFFSNRNQDKKRKPNIGQMMFWPYARIIPMHLGILFGFKILKTGAPKDFLILFLGLKTLADLTMHLSEHKTS